MAALNVLVHGALGKMGRSVINAVHQDRGLNVVGAVDVQAGSDRMDLAISGSTVPIWSDLSNALATCRPDVMVDFTRHDAVMPAVRLAVENGIHLVIGTTGLSQEELDAIDALSRQHSVGAVVAPNYSLGAVLMMHLAGIAARYFDYAEIIEMLHEQKVDSPSGTSIATARGMVQSRGSGFRYPESEKESIAGARGAQYEGIALHSVRSPGCMAHQEIILGIAGETLRIRHDQISRDAFGPGITLTIKEVVKSKGLTYGLDRLLGLQE